MDDESLLLDSFSALILNAPKGLNITQIETAKNFFEQIGDIVRTNPVNVRRQAAMIASRMVTKWPGWGKSFLIDPIINPIVHKRPKEESYVVFNLS